jgi:hypothetical protein
MQATNNDSIYRIAAIWAFAESGLGGLMHALKIPFTGIFVGGMAVLMLILLAHQAKFKVIVQLTLLVILVKLIASPQSPPPAYLAVAFQGISAAIIFTLVPHKKIASILFAVLAMMESALQKIIITTLIYGNAFWEAIDLFSKSVLKEMGTFADFQLSWWLISAYCGIYFIWGIILGFWGLSIHKRKEQKGIEISKLIYQNSININLETTNKSNRKKDLLPFISVFIISGMLLVFYFMGLNNKDLIWVLIRSLTALLFMIFILNPLLKFYLKKWSKKQSETRKLEIEFMLNSLPKLKYNWMLSKELVRIQSEKYSIFQLIETFIFLSLIDEDLSKK